MSWLRESVVKELEEKLAKGTKSCCFWHFKTKWGSSCWSVWELLKREINTYNTRSNPGRCSTINIDGWKAYDGLILNGYDHYRVFHSNNEFARGKCHVNGIESFWSFAKRRMNKFNGMKNDKFIFHLKECESETSKNTNPNNVLSLDI
jgi:hypothetical protein